MMAKTPDLTTAAIKCTLEDMLPLRPLFLQETNIQIRYDACHIRNWSDPYLLYLEDRVVGYGAVKGKSELADRDAIFEFFVLPACRKWAGRLFARLVEVTGVSYVECQSNDFRLTALLYEYCRNIHSDTILFEDEVVTQLELPGIIFRRWQQGDHVFGKSPEDVGTYVLEKAGAIVATGGFLTHYNPPFADLYMEVKSDCRNRGYGSFILQEIKKECYLAGRVPAARCSMKNKASRATLIKAGFRVCGFMLIGELR